MLDSFRFTHVPKMASFPNARFVRGFKLVVILCPILVLIFVIIFTLGLVVSHDQQNPTGHGISKRRTVKPESIQEMVERTGICDFLESNQHLLQKSNNAQLISITLDNGSRHQLNSTVLSTCVDLKKAKDLYFSAKDVRVNPFSHTFIRSGSHICDKSTDIIVLVHSLHTYYSRRKAIRDTWGGAITGNKWPGKPQIGTNIKLAFVLGIFPNKTIDDTLKEEDDVYHDIIQGDFHESYQNMTLKSLLGLKWADTYCRGARYLIKSDDDMIINFPYMVQVLNETNMIWAVMGPYNRGSRALKRGKWSIPHAKYPFYFYPPYESGSAYVISSDLISPLLRLSDYVPHIFIDDVYITGILGKILGIRHVTHPGFAYWTSKRPNHCDLWSNKILTGTKMRPSDLWNIWADLVKDSPC